MEDVGADDDDDDDDDVVVVVVVVVVSLLQIECRAHVRHFCS